MDPILFPLHNENRSVPQTIRPQDNKELPTQLQRVGNISLRNGHIFSELKEENDESYQNVLEQVSNEQALPDSALLVRSVVNLFHKSDEVDSPQDILHSKVNSNIQLFSCDNQVVYSCKHKFPFRTVKSHPKVYYTDRRYKMKTKRPVVDNSDTTAQRINGDKHCLLNKYELLRLITRTDIAIAETERKIEHLRQQLKHFPLSADRRNGFSSIKNLSYKIYEENRRKAETSYSTVLKVSPNSISISGIQPYETKVLKENAEKYEVFRPLLMEYLSKKRQAQSAVTNMTAHLYLTWKTAWLTELNMLEESEAWKKRESSKLEYFEKVFPELRIERENWEILRSATVRTRNRTLRKDYMCFLKEKQLIDEKRSRLCAAQIPDLLDREARDQAINKNGQITDFKAVYGENQMRNMFWTAEEKELFKQKFMEFPKAFGVIASYFKVKTTSDCVYFYYMNKKLVNYKELFFLRDGRRFRPKAQRPRAVLGGAELHPEGPNPTATDHHKSGEDEEAEGE